MSNFDQYARAGKCDVCRKETMVAVCASTMGPVSLAYCRDCLESGAEPYSFMVAYVACAGEWLKDIRPEAQTRIRKLLAFHNKTEAKFAEDVAVLQKAETEWIG